MAWNFDQHTPIYQQIITQMKRQIVSGRYEPGSRIASVREIALEAGVNPNTMQRALSELEREGLLRTERTSGRYVTEDEAVLQKVRSKLAEGYIAQLFANLGELGMTHQEIVDAVEDYDEYVNLQGADQALWKKDGTRRD